MKIQLTDFNGNIFAEANNWNDTNIAVKAIFKRRYWSNVYYNLKLDGFTKVYGQIDLEPRSFWERRQNTIVTEHLKTFWTNISKLSPGNPHGITKEEIESFTRLLKFLPQ